MGWEAICAVVEGLVEVMVLGPLLALGDLDPLGKNKEEKTKKDRR